MFCILFTDEFWICEEKKNKNKEQILILEDNMKISPDMEIYGLEDPKFPFAFRVRSFRWKQTFLALNKSDREEWNSFFLKAIMKTVENQSSIHFSNLYNINFFSFLNKKKISKVNFKLKNLV